MKMSTNELGLGLPALSRNEEMETRGGTPWLLPALVAGLIVSFFNNFGDIREGYADGLKGTPRH